MEPCTRGRGFAKCSVIANIKAESVHKEQMLCSSEQQRASERHLVLIICLEQTNPKSQSEKSEYLNGIFSLHELD